MAQCPCQGGGKSNSRGAVVKQALGLNQQEQAPLRLRFPEGGDDGNRVRGGNQSAEHQ